MGKRIWRFIQVPRIISFRSIMSHWHLQLFTQLLLDRSAQSLQLQAGRFDIESSM